MGKRLDVDWTSEPITDGGLLDLFNHVAHQLTGLVMQEHSEGRVLMFVDKQGRLLHVLYNISDNNWGCFCNDALDGECAASTYARVRLMKSIAENP